MNINSEPEFQPEEPKRSSIFGLVSSIFGVLTIVYNLISICNIPIRTTVDLTIVSVLSAIAIIVAGIDLYLRSRKISVGPIIASITVLTNLAILGFDVSFIPEVIVLGLLLWGFLYSVTQIILVIKNDDAKLARLGIALALLCTVFSFVVSFIVGMIMGM